MSLRERVTSALRSAAGLMFALALWAAFGPTAAGGSASYIMIAGASMEPALETGDLVIARQSTSYAVGDIVAYQHPRLGPIIHRIIAVETGRFVLQGDNNAWIDSYEPSPSEILGRSWLTLPGVATRLQALRHPGWLAVFSVLLAMAVMGVLRLPGSKPTATAKRPADGPAKSHVPPGVESYVLLFAVIGLAGLLLAVAAFRQPVSKTVEAMVPYEQAGEFSYRAQGPRTVYDQGQVTTGDPIFRSLMDKFEVQFEYAFRSEAPADVLGTYALLAEVQDANGWTRRLTLVPQTRFEGSALTIVGEVRLDVVQAMVDFMRLQTGLQRAAFTLSVFPEIEVTGTLAGRGLETSFAPRLDFLLDDLQVSLPPDLSTDPEIDPLNPVRSGGLTYLAAQPNSIRILGIPLNVLAARWLAVILLVVALAGLGYLAWRIEASRRAGEAQWIQARYSDLILSTQLPPETEGLDVIPVASFADLVRVAKHSNLLVAHWIGEGQDNYAVRQADRLYLYQVAAALPQDAVQDTQDSQPGESEPG